MFNLAAFVLVSILLGCDSAQSPANNNTSGDPGVTIEDVQKIIEKHFDTTWNYETTTMGEKACAVRSLEYMVLQPPSGGSDVSVFLYLRFVPRSGRWALQFDSNVTFDDSYVVVSSPHDKAMGIKPEPNTIRVKFDSEEIVPWQVCGSRSDFGSLFFENSAELNSKLLLTDRFVVEVQDSYGSHQFSFKTSNLEDPMGQ